MKGDDHKQAPDLPGDFEDVTNWANVITNLYEHRLKADYDNWGSTKSEMSLTPAESVAFAEQFVRNAGTYLEGKFGIKL